MKEFSQRTLELLWKAGWNKERAVDTSEYEKRLKSEGYPIHTVVVDFLKSFVDLRLVYPHFRVPQEEDEFIIDPILAAADIYPENVTEDYSERVGMPLCVIGEAFSRHMTVMMASDGKVYAGYTDVLILVGNSGTDAIEALCSGREMPKIP